MSRSTLYSHTLRILTCVQCGAPLEASASGGRFTCTYCGAASTISRRDESADLSAANAGRVADISESERYARLRQQDRQPPPLPDTIAALLVDGHLPEDRVARAEAEWRDVRSQIAITPSFPICERFFHLTVILAPHFDERRRRAALETAVEVLPDGGHRHVLRCMLAREAARAGDFTAAEAWLAPTNPRPTDLAEDTAYRLAAATLASARREYPKVAELLGFSRDDVPLENRNEVACWILRLDALEKLGRTVDANREMSDLVRQWGRDRIRNAIALHAPLRLCEQSFGQATASAEAEARANVRAAAERGIHALEEQLGRLDRPLAKLFVELLIGTVVVTFLVGTVWTCVVSSIIEADPLFGRHAHMVCPRVCDDCRAPYHIVSWHTESTSGDSSTLNVYCSDAGGRLESMEANNQLWLEAVNGASWLERYEVPGGIWTLGLSIQVLFAPLALVFVFALKLRGWLGRREQKKRIRSELGAARAHHARL